MVGFIVSSSSLNSFGSICYCIVTLGIHAYACFKDITRYREADTRVWPTVGDGQVPTEVPLLLGLTILSLMVIPFFCVASFIKVGNFASDGVKLGRDQDQKPATNDNDSTKDKEIVPFGFRFKKKLLYLWRHSCPVAQTLHLIIAFLLLLPEVLLTAVEIKYGYKSADVAWESELDFLFPTERSMMSQIKASVNLTSHPNATHFEMSGSRSSSGGWGDRINVGIAFVHFCIALTCFLVRYASVFWYTNKALTLVFAIQLLSVVINSIFGFNSFATLYCVCHNQKVFPNVHLSVGCAADLTLYLISGTILFFSTITVFEYGSHYFHEKSKIVERNHATDTFMKRTVIVNSGCQGYIPHSCAMGALVLYAIFKGPLIYDMVSLMRLTSDQLMLSGVICEVCYMVTWVMLWFGLTVKQKWKFRILDYVTLRHVKSLPLDGSMVKINAQGKSDSSDSGSLNRMKRLSNSNNIPIRYVESSGHGTNSSCEEPCPSDLGTDESDQVNNMTTAEVVLSPEGPHLTVDSSSLRRARGRRNIGARVTFNENGRNSGNFEEEPLPHGSLPRRESQHRDRDRHPDTSHRDRPPDTSHMHVIADVHTTTPSVSPGAMCGEPSSQNNLIKRRYSDHRDAPISREYRNSLRIKCEELYSSENSVPSNYEETDLDLDSPGTIPPLEPLEPLPTLMSSFRDRVRESSLAASSFKERERHMLERYHTYDDHVTASPHDVNPNEYIMENCNSRQGYTISDENIANDHNQNLHHQHHHHHHPNSNEHLGHMTEANLKHQSVSRDDSPSTHIANSTLESSDSGLPLPPVHEDSQLGRVRRRPREDYLVGDTKGPYHQQQQQPPHHPHHHHKPPSQQQHHQHHQHQQHLPPPHPRPLKVMLAGKKGEIGRRDSANYSLTSSQDTSSNESDHGGQGLCSQV